jgi:hypothetical protein
MSSVTTGVPSWATAERWTNRQMAEACLQNVQDTARLERQLRGLYNSLLPGDARLVGDKEHPPLRLQILTAAAEQAHWRRELAFWRGRCVDEGEDAMPPREFKVKKAAARPSYIDDPALNGDPIVEQERTRRTQQTELEQLARTAAAEGRVDQVEDEVPF